MIYGIIILILGLLAFCMAFIMEKTKFIAGGILLVITITVFVHLKENKQVNSNMEITILEQCYYAEYDFTQDSSPYPLKDFSFFRYKIDKNLVEGEDYYFRAESDSYLTKFVGTAEKEETIIRLDTTKEGESEEGIWEEDFTFKTNLDGVLLKDSFGSDLEKISCESYYDNLKQVDLYYKEISSVRNSNV